MPLPVLFFAYLTDKINMTVYNLYFSEIKKIDSVFLKGKDFVPGHR